MFSKSKIKMANKIYTRTGDNGMTSLGKFRIAKTHPLMDVMGKLDELQAALGLAEVLVQQNVICPNRLTDRYDTLKLMSEEIILIQEYLYELAGRIHQNYKRKETWSLMLEDLVLVNDEDPSSSEMNSLAYSLEQKMDLMNKELPKLTHFIRPGGKDMALAQFHVCRTACRDLERKLHIALKDESCLLEQDAKDVNRMSDWLFVLGRYYHKIMYPKEEECLFIHKK